MNLPLNIDIVQILLHMLNLVILVGGLTLILYKPVVKFLNQRRDVIAAQEKKNAEDAAANAQMKADYEEKMRQAQDELRRQQIALEQETAQNAEQVLSEAQNKADALLRAAEEEAETRKEHILDSAQTEIQELVLEATHKLLADTASSERDAELYDRFIRMAQEEQARE